jgi:hypothetical protein
LAEPLTLHIGSTSDAIAAVPYLLGFHPSDSIALIVIRDSEGVATIRLDADSEIAMIDHVAGWVIEHRGTVIIVGYGPDETIRPVVDRLCDRLVDAAPSRVLAAARVHEGRYWCYICPSPGCSHDGVPIDIATSQVAATATVHGLVALPNRTELENTLQPTGDRQVAAAVRRAEQRSRTRTSEQMIREGVRLVRDVITRTCATGRAATPSAEEIASLAVLLTHLRVRDEAWALIRPPNLNAHVFLWTAVLRAAPVEYSPAPACLLAYAAYSAGEGALAHIAVERARSADPDYSMARLLAELFVSGLDPRLLQEELTPEQLNADHPVPDIVPPTQKEAE